MNILDSIMAERRADVAAARAARPLAELERLARERTHHSLAGRLRERRGTAIVAEAKQASPSAGLLRRNYRPADIARGYRRAGAAGMSVLTEPRHFKGGEEHLRAARQAVDLPILRKDFLCDPYQVYESAAWGADVVLLIVAALEPAAIRPLYEAARACNLEVLAEAHTEAEIEQALALDTAIVGVNSRDLKTLRTDLDVSRRLAELIPPDRLSMAESGIRTRTDVERLEAAGYDGFLVGEVIMSADEPETKLRELIGATERRT